MKWKTDLWLTPLALSLGALVIRAQPPVDWKSELVRKAPAKWEAFREFARRLQGSITARNQSKLGGTHLDITIFDDIKQNQTCSLIRTRSVKKRLGDARKKEASENEMIFGANSKYAFSIAKRRAGWVLEDLLMDPKAKVTPTKQSVAEYVLTAISGHFNVLDQNLASLIEGSKINVTKVVAEKTNNPGRVSAEFQYSGGPSNLPQLSGRMLLSPENLWCVLGFDSFFETDGTKTILRAKNEFKTYHEVYPVPVRTSFEWVNQAREGATRVRQVTLEFDLREDANVPESHFTLSAFGLPEPKGITWREPSRWHLWFIAAGIIAAGVGLALHRARRRAKGEVKALGLD